jgi:hypothetical protein
VQLISPEQGAPNLEDVVRDLERRWGLCLVSFLPAGARLAVDAMQRRVRALLGAEAGGPEPPLEFYDLDHLHCTHFTFRRASAGGPVKGADVLGHRQTDIDAFVRTIVEAVAETSALPARLDHLSMGRDGRSLTLLGQCVAGPSSDARHRMLSTLYERLTPNFNLQPRPHDAKPDEYHKLQVRFAFLKRALQDYASFRRQYCPMQFEPIEFALDTAAIVHHRNRLLRPPQEGMVTIELGGLQRRSQPERDLARDLHLL